MSLGQSIQAMEVSSLPVTGMLSSSKIEEYAMETLK